MKMSKIKKILWIKKEKSVENDVMNDNDKVFWYNETRDATRVRERDEDNEWMFRKTSNEIEENNQKIEKNDREDEKYDWKKHLNKDND